jgi:hypothetical protein
MDYSEGTKHIEKILQLTTSKTAVWFGLVRQLKIIFFT